MIQCLGVTEQVPIEWDPEQEEVLAFARDFLHQDTRKDQAWVVALDAVLTVEEAGAEVLGDSLEEYLSLGQTPTIHQETSMVSPTRVLLSRDPQRKRR